jgi:hypothetical protein
MLNGVVQLCNAYLVRCALQFSAPLLTLDAQLGAKARIANIQIVEV